MLMLAEDEARVPFRQPALWTSVSAPVFACLINPFALLLLLSPTAALLPGLVGVVNYKASSRALRIAARGGVGAHSAAGGGVVVMWLPGLGPTASIQATPICPDLKPHFKDTRSE